MKLPDGHIHTALGPRSASHEANKSLTFRSRIFWNMDGDAFGMRVVKLSARLSGRLPITFNRASALAISRVT